MKDDASDLTALCLPFTAGVASGAALAGGSASGAAAGAALAAATGLLAWLSQRRPSPLPFSLLFFVLGLFCFLSAGLLPRGLDAGPHGRAAGRALSAMQRLIDAVPFRDEGTRPLITALLTGERGGLSAETTAAFRGSGASHILALSGLHLGVIYLIISRILSIFGNSIPARRIRSAVTVLFSGFYTLATGAGPSIVRAFLFILIRETASVLPERRTSPARTLMSALTIQLALDPTVITSLGFQLSYLAMTGITILYPRLEAWYPPKDASASTPSRFPSTHDNNRGSEAWNPSKDTNAPSRFPSTHDNSIGSEAWNLSKDTSAPSRFPSTHDNSIGSEAWNPPKDTNAPSSFPSTPDNNNGGPWHNVEYIMDVVQKTTEPVLRRIWQGAALAISCQVFTAPLAWLRFHTFPKYFLLTNLLAMPLTSALMASSVAALALQGLPCGCPQWLASCCDTLAHTLLFTLNIISSL